jgi:hypothetical protein
MMTLTQQLTHAPGACVQHTLAAAAVHMHVIVLQQALQVCSRKEHNPAHRRAAAACVNLFSRREK